MDNQYIVYAKKTYQTSEDTWERANVTFIVDANTTLVQIMEWAVGNGVDMNTIRILPNTKPNN